MTWLLESLNRRLSSKFNSCGSHEDWTVLGRFGLFECPLGNYGQPEHARVTHQSIRQAFEDPNVGFKGLGLGWWGIYWDYIGIVAKKMETSI